jgi:hypothetical protein
LIGAVQIILAFALMLVALVELVSSHATEGLLRIVVVLGGTALVLLLVVNQLWVTLSGRILLVIVAFGLLSVLRVRKAGDE